MTAPRRHAPLITLPMVATVLLLASTPLWIKQAGLYQYLALEIMIWMLFAMGHNLLLGYGGLPSFGHGAFFGIGAYGLGLLQLKAGAGVLAALLGAVLLAAAFGALVAAFISHRRGIYYALLTIAFGQVFWFVAIKWHSGHRRRGRAARHQAAARCNFSGWRHRPEAATRRFFYFALLVLLPPCAGGAVAAGAFALRPRAARHQAERDARRLRRPQRVALQVGWCSCISAAHRRGWPAGCSRLAQQSAYPNVMSLHNSGFVVMMVLIGGGLVSFWGPLIGATPVHPGARSAGRLHRDLVAVVRPAVHRAMVLFQPEGVAGAWQRLARHRLLRRQPRMAAARMQRTGTTTTKEA